MSPCRTLGSKSADQSIFRIEPHPGKPHSIEAYMPSECLKAKAAPNVVPSGRKATCCIKCPCFVTVSTQLPTYLPACLPACLQYLPVHPSSYPSTCPSVLSIYLSICPSVYLSVYLCVCLSIRLVYYLVSIALVRSLPSVYQLWQLSIKKERADCSRQQVSPSEQLKPGTRPRVLSCL